jgi:hypothetical protein
VSDKAQHTGKWLAKITCPAFAGARGYSIDFVATIENGHFHAAKGIIGQPGSFIWDGDIEPNGRAMIAQAGYTGNGAYTLKNAPAGTFTRIHHAVQFDATRGSGSRVEDGSNGRGRPYNLTAFRQ